MDVVGVVFEDVIDVIFIYVYFDYLWGVLDDFGDLLFYDVIYYIGWIEWDYWIDLNMVDIIGDVCMIFVVGVKCCLEEIVG